MELSANEARALQGLLRHPGLSDREVAGLIGMGTSSLVTARLRLERGGYVRTIAVPAVQRLGAEFLSVSYTRFDSLPLREAVVDRLAGVVRETEVFSLFLETSQCMFMQFARSYTDARRNIEAIETVYREHGSLLRGFTTAIFPFGMSRLVNYFDYSHLFDRADAEKESSEAWRVEPLFDGGGPADLTAMGQRVMLGILDHPAMSDTELAGGIGVSRMTVGKWRNALLSEGLVSARREPALGMLGMELLVLTHGTFAKGLSRGLRRFMPELMGTMGPVLFAVLGNDDILVLSTFSSFTHYREANNLFLSKVKEHEIFASPPERVMFSLRAMRMIKPQEYGPLVRRLLAPRGWQP